MVFGCSDSAVLYELLCKWEEKRPVGPGTIKHWMEVVDRVDELMDARGWEKVEIDRFCELVRKSSKEVQNEGT